MKAKTASNRIILLTLSTVMLGLIIALHFTVNASTMAASKPGLTNIDEDAFVYILSIGMGNNHCHYRGLRNAFVIANGRYILTAAHCVEDFEDTSQFLQQPMIISPYYGDVFEAKIIAVDRDNDIAILEPSWDAHPALALETDKNWKKSKTITIAGYPPTESKRGGNGELSKKILAENVTLENTKGKGHSAIQVGPVNYPGKGWSGSPFLNPKTGKVVGILSRERYLKKLFIFTQHHIYSPDVDAIQALINNNNLSGPTRKTILPDMDRRKKFERILSVMNSFRPHNKKQTLSMIKELCNDYPDSFFPHLLSAWVSSSPESETSYQKALETAPKSSLVRAAYGQHLLANNKHEQANRQFQIAIDLEPDNIAALHGKLASLVITDPDEAEKLGQNLTRRWPDNPGFWFEYSKALKAQKKYEQEVPAIQKAMELTNDAPYLYWRHMADSLVAKKSYGAADLAFQSLLEKHECERCWLSYASLLIKIGPEKAEDIRQAIDKAKTFNKNPYAPSRKYRRYERSLKKLTSDPNTITDPNQ